MRNKTTEGDTRKVAIHIGSDLLDDIDSRLPAFRKVLGRDVSRATIVNMALSVYDLDEQLDILRGGGA